MLQRRQRDRCAQQASILDDGPAQPRRRDRQRLILANFCGSRTPPCSRSDRFCYKNGPFHSGDAFALAASAPYRDLYYASVTIPMGLRSLTEIAVFSGSAHPLLAAEICSHLDVPLLPSQVERYANDCLGVQLQANCRERDVFIIQPLVRRCRSIWSSSC